MYTFPIRCYSDNQSIISCSFTVTGSYQIIVEIIAFFEENFLDEMVIKEVNIKDGNGGFARLNVQNNPIVISTNFVGFENNTGMMTGTVENVKKALLKELKK